MSDVVMVTLITATATIVSGLVGALAKPLVLDRLERRRRQADIGAASKERQRQRLLDLKAAMAAVLEGYVGWANWEMFKIGQETTSFAAVTADLLHPSGEDGQIH